MTAALETRGLCKSFGALTVADNIDFALEPARAPRAHRPERGGKTTFVNMLTGVLAPSSARSSSAAGTSPASRRLSASGAASGGPSRSTRCSAAFTVLDNVALRNRRRNGIGHRMGRPASRYTEIIDESVEL